MAGVNGRSPTTKIEKGQINFFRLFSVGTVTLTLVIVLTPSWYQRAKKMTKYHSMVAYRVSDSRYEYNLEMLTEGVKQKVIKMQELTDPGETILAWLETPFFLDFSRNRVFCVAASGMINSGVEVEKRFSGGGEQLREYFRKYGIRYVIWGHRGTRPEKGKSLLRLAQSMSELGLASKIIHEDNRNILFDITEQ
jgi:hypothetical protein